VRTSKLHCSRVSSDSVEPLLHSYRHSTTSLHLIPTPSHWRGPIETHLAASLISPSPINDLQSAQLHLDRCPPLLRGLPQHPPIANVHPSSSLNIPIMAAHFDDEDLSLSLPVFDRETPHQNQPAIPIPAGMADSLASHNDSPSQVRNSQRLGQYKVKRTLGEGSFGKVKLAVHEVSGQQVALKIIARRKLVSRDMAGRVEREIQYLQLLRHPHIIKLYVISKRSI
jgi:hypothetical protein